LLLIGKAHSTDLLNGHGIKTPPSQSSSQLRAFRDILINEQANLGQGIASRSSWEQLTFCTDHKAMFLRYPLWTILLNECLYLLRMVQVKTDGIKNASRR